MEVDESMEVPSQGASEGNCGSPGFDGLDDDLFQDLEDLGEVLDELAREAEETEPISELNVETPAVVETAKKPDRAGVDTPLQDASVVEAKKSGSVPLELDKTPAKTDTSQATPVEVVVDDEDELEDGEILDDEDQEKELEELHKKRSEIINKMKRLVKHKIQLTSQRKDLIQGLKLDTHESISTLLKENALLGKAISNQIFRMNPDMKKLSEKIKELKATLSLEIDEDDKSGSTPSQASSETDFNSLSRFFGRISSPREKNKLLEKNTVNRIQPAFKRPVKEVVALSLVDKAQDDLEKTKLSLYGSRLRTEKQSNSLNSLGQSSSLTGNNERMKKIFDRVCQMNTKPATPMDQEEESKPLEVKKKPVIDLKKIFDRACDITAAKQGTTVNNENPSESNVNINPNDDQRLNRPISTPGVSEFLSNSIDFNLKQIRRNCSINSSNDDVSMDASDSSGRSVNQARTPIIFKSSSLFEGSEDAVRKPKTPITFNSNQPTWSGTGPKKFHEPAVVGRLSKSLLNRLGPGSNRVGAIDNNESKATTDHPDSEMFGVSGLPARLDRPQDKRKAFYCGFCKQPFRAGNDYIVHLESVQHLNQALAARNKKKKGGITATDTATADANLADDGSSAWYKGLSKKPGNTQSSAPGGDSGHVFCIAVTGKDSFCSNINLGYSHPRCFDHAKCLQHIDDKYIGYCPERCSVCMEYLSHCNTSLKCCEKIFRMFKHFRKSFGYRFDWENKSLKDWFFDNYRKLQSSNPSEKSGTLTYADFMQSQKLSSDTSENEPPMKIAAPCGVDKRPVPLSNVRKDLSTTNNKVSDEASANNAIGDSLCHFITKYSGVKNSVDEQVQRHSSDKQVHSYLMSFEETDPFITDICKNLEYLDNNTIPSTSLLAGLHTEFQCVNKEGQQLMTLLNQPLKSEDICFQIGEHKAYCSKRLMDRYNFTSMLTKSQYNLYAALRALRSGIAKFPVNIQNISATSEFHSVLVQSLDTLAKEMICPLKYYFKLIITDKRRLRRSGFLFKAKDVTMSQLVRENILSKDLFDRGALTKAVSSLNSIVELLNKNESLGSEKTILDGTSVLENSNLSVKKSS